MIAPPPQAPTSVREWARTLRRPPIGITGWPGRPTFEPYTVPTAAIGLVADGWFEWCYSPADHCIYAPPFAATTVAKYDIDKDTFSTFGSLGAGNKWTSAVLAPNGCIYCAPYASSNILKIDPLRSTTTLIANPAGFSVSGSKCLSGVLASNGIIYFAPVGATSILAIDPSTDIPFHFGTTSGSGNYGFTEAAGHLWSAPGGAAFILKVDPQSRTVKSIATSATANAPFVLAPNGMLYSPPYGTTATTILKVDPVTEKVSTIAVTGMTTGTNKWSGGGKLAADGIIYAVPHSITKMLALDPATDTYRLLDGFENPQCANGVAIPDGRVIQMPRSKARGVIVGRRRPTRIIDAASFRVQAKSYTGAGNWLDEVGTNHGVAGGGAGPTWDAATVEWDYNPALPNYHTMGNAAALDVTTGSFTVALYLKLTSTAVTYEVFNKRPGSHGAGDFGWNFRIAAGTPTFVARWSNGGVSGTDFFAPTSSILTAGVYATVIGVWDAATSTATCYTNGVAGTPQTGITLSTITNTTAAYLGTRADQNVPVSFAGSLRCAWFANGLALNAAQAADLNAQLVATP